MKNFFKKFLQKIQFIGQKLQCNKWLDVFLMIFGNTLIFSILYVFKFIIFILKCIGILVMGISFLVASLWILAKGKLAKKPKKFYLKWGSIGALSVAGSVAALVFLVYFGAFGKLPSEKELTKLKQAEASLLYDNEKHLIGKFFVFDRTNVSYTDFPPYLINALIATEDVRFHNHKGVDTYSLFRVFFKTLLLQNDSSGGGSTLTMQLAKNIFGRERHRFLSMPINKIKEMIIARRIENVYSKSEIITIYLNTVPFSDNTYGIESASQRFFGKSVTKLTLNEAATLIGSLKATYNYNPRLSPEKSTQRRNTVLAQMKKYDLLSEEDFASNSKDTLVISYQSFADNQGVAPYFREQIRLQVPEILKNIKKADGSSYNLYQDGLRIYTTLNKTMQEYAEKAVRKHLAHLQKDFESTYGTAAPWLVSKEWLKNEAKKLPIFKSLEEKGHSTEEIWKILSEKKEMDLSFYQKDNILKHSTLDSLSHYIRLLNTGFVAVEPQTGAILSYVGGIDFENFKYDHVVQSKRQVGSIFKPIVYASALQMGLPICSHFSPNPITYIDYDGWTPTNSGGIIADPHTYFSIAKALRESTNTIAVQVLFYAGLENVMALSRKMGIKSPIPAVPSIALGSAELSVLEMAKAYTTFANKGTSTNPYFIEKITDKHGKTIWQHKPAKNTQALTETTTQAMTQLMRGTINEGTASRMRGQYGLTNDIAGKTGTTQDNKDGWFAAFTPNLVMISWVGNDKQIGFKNTRIGQGANSALPITAIFLQQLNKNSRFKKLTRTNFEISEEIQTSVSECASVVQDNFIDKLIGEAPKDSVSGRSGANLYRMYRTATADTLQSNNENEELPTEENQEKRPNLLERIFGR